MDRSYRTERSGFRVVWIMLIVAGLSLVTALVVAAQETGDTRNWGAGPYISPMLSCAFVSGIKERPAIDIKPDGTLVAVPGFTDGLVLDDWSCETSALTGVMFRRELGGVYLGLGGGTAGMTGNNAGREIAAAITAHFGVGRTELILGYIFSHADEVVLPPGIQQIRYPTGSPPDLIVPGSSSLGRFMVGITGLSFNLVGG